MDEVRSAFERREDIGLINTQGLSYMQAVLEEALRMYPPVAGGGSARLVARGGVQIADYFVPENVGLEFGLPATRIGRNYGDARVLIFLLRRTDTGRE